MTQPSFNPDDAKYKCCFDFLHVKIVAKIICVLALVYQLSFACGIFYYQDFSSYKAIFIAFLTMFLFGAALFGIIYSEPKFFYPVVAYYISRIIFFGAVLLFLFAAHISESLPSLAEQFCRYLAEEISGKKNSTETTKEIGVALLHFAVQLAMECYIFNIINKCRQYITDKAANDKLSQS